MLRTERLIEKMFERARIRPRGKHFSPPPEPEKLIIGKIYLKDKNLFERKDFSPVGAEITVIIEKII